ncbi:MAG: CBS domain-containing protein [Deltaproteobacteria bacterium]|nr:CBS domain-containing protein [Deltaproteobacteria bacterium]MCB9788961.1 CBS domain-containing protein [Deltaproteobacteria bacterium]
MNRTLGDIVGTRSRPLVTIAPEASAMSAAELLCEHRIGALVVVDDTGAMVGIVSERDLMRSVAERVDLDAQTVGEVMTRDVIVGLDTDALNHAMGVMTERRIRHLPIMRAGRAEAMVSIGDIVNALRTEERVVIRDLNAYIMGTYR